MSIELEARVDRLEEALMRLAYAQMKTEMEIQEMKRDTQRLKDEMRAFKDEMKVFKDEMLAFKDEMRAFKEEMKVFKDEMRGFKDEMKKRWGDLANKMGTMVEDVFLPSVDLAILKAFGVEAEDVQPRRRIRRKGVVEGEVDVLVVSHSRKVAFVVEVKSYPDDEEHIERFEGLLRRVRELIPELSGYEVYGIYAGLSMREETIRELTRRGIYAMVVRGDILEVPNLEELRGSARRW